VQNISTTKKELRQFGLVMTIPLGILTVIFYLKDNPGYLVLAVLALFFLAAGLLLPAILKPIRVVWLKFAEILGWVMNRVILTLTFIVIMTPVGIVLKLMRKDILKLSMQSDVDSYWEPVEADGPASRPDKPY